MEVPEAENQMLAELIQSLSVEESLVQGTDLSGSSGRQCSQVMDYLNRLTNFFSIYTKKFHPIILHSQ